MIKQEQRQEAQINITAESITELGLTEMQTKEQLKQSILFQMVM